MMGLDATQLVAILLGLAMAAALAFAIAPGQSDKAGKRAKALAAGDSHAAKRSARKPAQDANSKRRQAQQEALKDLEEKQKQARKSRLSIAGRLRQAGLSLSEPAFWTISGIIAAVTAGGLFLIGTPPLAIVTSTIGAGLGMPRWVLGMLIKRRQTVFLNQFADGVDVIVRGIKSGLPLNQCLQIVASESAEPLKSEFQTLVDGQSMGVPMSQNLQRMFERMPLAEINFFGTVLVIQQKTGGNLSEALGNLSSVLRSRKLLKEKIKALSAEAKASAAIIACLPLMVMGLVYMSRPDYITLLFVRQEGQAVLMFCAMTMATGVFVMKRMIDFKH